MALAFHEVCVAAWLSRITRARGRSSAPTGARVAVEDVAYVRHWHKAHRVERPGTALSVPDGAGRGASWCAAARLTVAKAAGFVMSVGWMRDCGRATPWGPEPEDEQDESPGVTARGGGDCAEKARAAADATEAAL
ncbi:hypothetical protein HW130_03475 [Streptomyces sp. PKU-EA00015]|uniref:hypothetical protein n=1 Tax=Streptomyces sp. PKU-EA00015 TaxID=2748326 RepID=UPI0015A31501|nr:hypothetical protein [Streptomyces sp. PKU-EA00015]NWF25334.1 hypothetical protein [Streptomyces sp. PKU-EA00015]